MALPLLEQLRKILSNLGGTDMAGTVTDLAYRIELALRDPAFKPNPNILINGGMTIAQRATTGTITAGTTVPTASLGYQTVDMWACYSVGGNPTVAQIAGSGNALNRLQITGVAGVSTVGVLQRIENINTTQLVGSNATISVDFANSLSLPVTWKAFYANTSNTFGTIGTPTKTQIATGTFTTTSTLTRFQATFACLSQAANGIEIEFTVGAQTSGTWAIGDVKLEKGGVATAFVNNVNDLLICRKFCSKYNNPKMVGLACSQTVVCRMGFRLDSDMFALPVLIFVGSMVVFDSQVVGVVTAINAFYPSINCVEFDADTSASTLTLGRAILTYVAPGTSVYSILLQSQIP